MADDVTATGTDAVHEGHDDKVSLFFSTHLKFTPHDLHRVSMEWQLLKLMHLNHSKQSLTKC